ncbi:MAG: hypothetical protein LH610_09415 [Sphingomonas bacterium]|nr:hypothetical protein [Sphingomonas bacterium]
MMKRVRLLLALAVGIAPSAASPAPVKPWVPHAEVECNWWLSGADGKSHAASIEQGDELMLSLSDAAFVAWSELEQPQVELIFNNDPKRSVFVEGWATHGGAGSTSSTFGLYLDAAARRTLGGATRLKLRRDGKAIIDMRLAATPSQAALDACVPPPKGPNSDEE